MAKEKETYLRWTTHLWLDSKVEPTLRGQGEYQVTTDDDGIPISEIKGWIKNQHNRYSQIGFNFGDSIKTKTTRPRQDVERYTTKINRGCWKGKVETTIVKLEKEADNPQGELF